MIGFLETAAVTNEPVRSAARHCLSQVSPMEAAFGMETLDRLAPGVRSEKTRIGLQRPKEDSQQDESAAYAHPAGSYIHTRS